MQRVLDAGVPVARRNQAGLHGSRKKKANLHADLAEVETPFRYVDIYVSAGPRENYDWPLPADYRSCNQDNTANCSIYKVRWDHSTNTAVVEKLEPARNLPTGVSQIDIGYVQPAVSPSGRWLLYVAQTSYQDYSGRTSISSALVLRNLLTGTTDDVFTRSAGSSQPQFPAWVEDAPAAVTYLWNAATGAGEYDTATVWEHVMLKGGGSYAAWDLESLGPGGWYTGTAGTSFEDGNVHANAADRGTTRLVTFGGVVGTPPTATEHIPQVTDLDGGDPEPVDISTSTPALTECHHPAFNVSGDEILCTGQEPAEALPGPFGAYRIRRLHGFAWDGSGWNLGAPLVGPLSSADFATIATDEAGVVQSNVFPVQTANPSTNQCRNYVWKFAEWCGSNRYVVATVYCTDTADAPAYNQILNSRVVLVDLDADDDTTGTPSAYHDITGWIEDFEGARPGSFNAIFSTCRRVGAAA